MPRILTFPITGVEVPPVAVVSRGADPLTDISSWSPVDITPTLWPPAGAKASAFEVEVTAIDEQFYDGAVIVAVSLDDALWQVPGTWSGDPGAIGSVGSGNDVEAWWFDKFGTWRTDYISFSSSAGTSNTLRSTNAVAMPSVLDSFATQEVDIKARVRVADWTDGVFGSIVAKRDFVGELARTHPSPGVAPTTTQLLQGVVDQTPHILFHLRGDYSWSGTATGSNTGEFRAYCPIAALGLTDGAWGWVRATFDNANGTQFWSSSDGVTWSMVHQVPISDWLKIFGGGLNPTSSGVLYAWSNTIGNAGNGLIYFGNGTNASAFYGVGFAGDISHASYGAEVGGPDSDRLHLNLDTMTSSTDAEWDGGLIPVLRSSSTTPAAVGALQPATRRVRFEFDDVTDVADFRLFVDAFYGASVSVDEIVLEIESGGGWVRGHAWGNTGWSH